MTQPTRQNRDLVLYGGGTVGRDVAMTIEAINRVASTWELLGFIDDNLEPFDDHHGIPILGGLPSLETLGRSVDEPIDVAITIGSATLRKELPEQVRRLRPECRFPNLVHPHASVDEEWNSRGDGNLIGAGARLLADAAIGSFNLLQANSVIALDARLGDRCWIGPGALVGERAEIGDDVTVGAGAVILPDVKVAAGTRVEPGEVVRDNLE